MTQMAVNRNEQTTVKARNGPFRSIYPFILSPKYPFCTFLAEVKKYQPSMWADKTPISTGQKTAAQFVAPSPNRKLLCLEATRVQCLCIRQPDIPPGDGCC